MQGQCCLLEVTYSFISPEPTHDKGPYIYFFVYLFVFSQCFSLQLHCRHTTTHRKVIKIAGILKNALAYNSVQVWFQVNSMFEVISSKLIKYSCFVGIEAKWCGSYANDGTWFKKNIQNYIQWFISVCKIKFNWNSSTYGMIQQ